MFKNLSINSYISKLAVLLFTLCSCTSLETLKSSTPQGDNFQKKLFEYYKDFADNEAKNCDWLDSQHFIDKAMLIVYGHNVLPEHPDDWKIPQENKLETLAYYNELKPLIDNKYLRSTFPENLAKAQFNYDCWLEELEENWQYEAIKHCKTNFENELMLLKDKLTAHNNQIKQSTPKKTEELKEQKQVEPKAKEPFNAQEKMAKNAQEFFQFRIFFEFNSSKLTAGAKQVLNKIADKINKMPQQPEEITLNGYTDHSGKEEYNLNLSKKRATAVKNYLTTKGLDPKKIVIYAFGEADIAFNTADNTREPGSRRVEIAIID
ncbi:OmpA family protein [Rickettsiales endosymbiont of Stachyamoeba lipophora]|uniref:OmpA family protein n=1 Tax=Rickettsiales endosymbiont of Stachyamoeba lipophora TaxID=2486578 RepID=UPI000F64FFC3|nr:OmpA family protein [Rickettsiales endosymbiont of Stachyamoeba lipophora]AZL16130.1 hypothetical protein EF513_06250 [Rickettsiales endosymbiont of Stachyamoeba lipophora]